MRMKAQLRRLRHFIQRDNLHRLLLFIGVLMLLSAVGLTWAEPNMSFPNALWWSIVTLTTVGYGDISPVTFSGRTIAIVIMFLGIGLLGMCSATIASVLVVNRIKEDRGMGTYDFTEHIIMCEWNQRSHSILQEIRADPHTAAIPVVLIADLSNNPTDDDDLFFIQGAVNDETLQRANLMRAKTVVILGQDRLEATARDAQAVLTTLTVESINPHAYTIVELVDASHAQFCERAHADEIIITSELSSRLISRAVLHHGMSKVVSELLSARHGNELYKVPVPPSMHGRSFLDIFVELKQKYASIAVAIQHGDAGEVLSNPAGGYQLAEDDTLIVIASERPQLA